MNAHKKKRIHVLLMLGTAILVTGCSVGNEYGYSIGKPMSVTMTSAQPGSYAYFFTGDGYKKYEELKTKSTSEAALFEQLETLDKEQSAKEVHSTYGKRIVYRVRTGESSTLPSNIRAGLAVCNDKSGEDKPVLFGSQGKCSISITRKCEIVLSNECL